MSIASMMMPLLKIFFFLHLGNWNLEFLRYVLPADVISKLTRIPIFMPKQLLTFMFRSEFFRADHQDKLIWTSVSSGSFCQLNLAII